MVSSQQDMSTITQTYPISPTVRKLCAEIRDYAAPKLWFHRVSNQGREMIPSLSTEAKLCFAFDVQRTSSDNKMARGTYVLHECAGPFGDKCFCLAKLFQNHLELGQPDKNGRRRTNLMDMQISTIKNDVPPMLLLMNLAFLLGWEILHLKLNSTTYNLSPGDMNDELRIMPFQSLTAMR